MFITFFRKMFINWLEMSNVNEMFINFFGICFINWLKISNVHQLVGNAP